MAARAALVSLTRILLEEVLDVVQQCMFYEPSFEVKSLHRNTILLLSFLDDFPGEAGDLEARIAIVADKAHDQAVHKVILSIRIRNLHLELDKYYREIGDFCNEMRS
ncbi:hypothetical protein ACS0TY_009255 [Phlomoides rotata]